MEFLAARAVRDSNASERPKFFAPLKFAGGDATSWPQQAHDDCVRNIRKRQRHNGLSCEMRFGWEAGIRTPISRVRVCCPTVGRPPSTSRALSGGNPDYTRPDRWAVKPRARCWRWDDR